MTINLPVDQVTANIFEAFRRSLNDGRKKVTAGIFFFFFLIRWFVTCTLRLQAGEEFNCSDCIKF